MQEAGNIMIISTRCARHFQALLKCTFVAIVLQSLGSAIQAQETPPIDLEALGIEFPEEPPPPPEVLPPTSLLNTPPSLIVPDDFGQQSPFAVAMESIFGEADSKNWRPLSFQTFLREGWNEPFVFTPRSTSGAPRQAWVNSFDGGMYRSWLNAFGYRQNVAGNGDSYFADWTAFIPLNRRLNLQLDVPYVKTNKAGVQNQYLTQFGDLNLTARLLLSESRDTTILAAASTSIPTGQTATAGGTTQLGYGLQFWHSMNCRWVVRGGINAVVPVNERPAGIRTSGNVNFAIGKYITEPGTPIFGDMVVYTSTNFISTLDNTGPNNSFFSITPGYRAEISNNWYHMAGVEIPMIGGPSHYNIGMQFWLLKVY